MEAKIKRFLDGYGYGDGSGYGSGDGDGYGDGYGSGVESFCGQAVHLVDGVMTLIDQVKGNTAKGRVLKSDLTTQPCWVAKVEGYFAHGGTLKDAVRDATKKAMDNMPLGQKIAAFRAKFPSDTDKYPAAAFFEWHNTLTGSCETGRKMFMSNKGISMDATFTVAEFVTVTKGSYRWDDVISRIPLR